MEKLPKHLYHRTNHFKDIESILDKKSIIPYNLRKKRLNVVLGLINLGISSKKILLYTAQPQKIIDDWNKKRMIPKNTYFTDKISRAEIILLKETS